MYRNRSGGTYRCVEELGYLHLGKVEGRGSCVVSGNLEEFGHQAVESLEVPGQQVKGSEGPRGEFLPAGFQDPDAGHECGERAPELVTDF